MVVFTQALASDPQIHTDGGIVQVKVDEGKDVEFHVGSKVSSVGSFEQGLADLGRQARADQQCACDAAEDVVGTAGAHERPLPALVLSKQTMACRTCTHPCSATSPFAKGVAIRALHVAALHTHDPSHRTHAHCTHVRAHTLSTSRCTWSRKFTI